MSLLSVFWDNWDAGLFFESVDVGVCFCCRMTWLFTSVSVAGLM